MQRELQVYVSLLYYSAALVAVGRCDLIPALRRYYEREYSLVSRRSNCCAYCEHCQLTDALFGGLAQGGRAVEVPAVVAEVDAVEGVQVEVVGAEVVQGGLELMASGPLVGVALGPAR